MVMSKIENPSGKEALFGRFQLELRRSVWYVHSLQSGGVSHARGLEHLKKKMKGTSAVRSRIFFETHICKLRVILRPRMLRVLYDLVKDVGRWLPWVMAPEFSRMIFKRRSAYNHSVHEVM